MSAINPYLTFGGNCGEAFDFYRSVFGGEFTSKMAFKEAPGDHPVSKEEENYIMHVSLPIGDGTVLMGSDRPAHMGQAVFGNGYSIAISGNGEKEADRLFNGLSAGGTVMMPMSKVFWGAYFGMFTDKFGVQWMINFNQDQQK